MNQDIMLYVYNDTLHSYSKLRDELTSSNIKDVFSVLDGKKSVWL